VQRNDGADTTGGAKSGSAALAYFPNARKKVFAAIANSIY